MPIKQKITGKDKITSVDVDENTMAQTIEGGNKTGKITNDIKINVTKISNETSGNERDTINVNCCVRFLKLFEMSIEEYVVKY